MVKIPTMFIRDDSVKGHPVTDQITPGCEWVLAGEGIATVKLDGTNVKIEGGVLFKRQKPKDREYDAASYAMCRRDDPSDRWAFEAFDRLLAMGEAQDGVYELCGPKVNGNPNRLFEHVMRRVVPPHDFLIIPEDHIRNFGFDGLRDYLSREQIEGIVFHHPDGRFAKIKRRDFGLPWPASC